MKEQPFKEGDVLESMFDDSHYFEVHQYLDEGDSIMLVRVDGKTDDFSGVILLGTESLDDYGFKVRETV